MTMDSQAAAAAMPKTSSAIQLYRALERANLLQYFDKFIAQGGDDLQQLCEAEEGEFFEIMELVGMSSKPLHVRRLQKVLQEYMANPRTFEVNTIVKAKAAPALETPITVATDYNVPSADTSATPSKTFASLAGLSQYSKQSFSPKFSQARSPGSPGTISANGDNASLSEEHIMNVRNAAMAIVQEMDMQSFPLPKKIPPEMVPILEMTLENPQREEEIRKWAPIYGRFDSKRKSEKPLSLHEVTVNEAACQLCLLEPNLLFMRDRLFPLSRQVVRESGYQYKHGHSSRSSRDVVQTMSQDGPASKKPRTGRDPDSNTRTVQAELMKLRREERMNEIASQLTLVKEQQANLKDKIALAKVDQNLQKIYDLQIELEKLTSQQLTLMTEQTDLIKRQRRSDRYYGSKSSRQGLEDIGASQGEFNSSQSEHLSASNEPEGGYANSDRTGSPKPEGRPSRRKGTPRSHHAFMKQALMDEGLRVAQGFNNGGEDYTDPALQNYRLEEDEELRRAYGLKESLPTVDIGSIKTEDFIKPDQETSLNGTDGEEAEGKENGHLDEETERPGLDVATSETEMQQQSDMDLQETNLLSQDGQECDAGMDLTSQQYVTVTEAEDMAMPQDVLAE